MMKSSVQGSGSFGSSGSNKVSCGGFDDYFGGLGGFGGRNNNIDICINIDIDICIDNNNNGWF